MAHGHIDVSYVAHYYKRMELQLAKFAGVMNPAPFLIDTTCSLVMDQTLACNNNNNNNLLYGLELLRYARSGPCIRRILYRLILWLKRHSCTPCRLNGGI